MPRSGSTWLYNAARLLLQKSIGQENLICGWIEDLVPIPTQGTVLVKVHDFDFALASRSAVILYSFRDLRDPIASFRRMRFPGKPSLTLAQDFIENDRFWRETADLVMRYESMIQDRESVVRNLSRTLGVEAWPQGEVVQAVAALKHDPSKIVGQHAYDSKCLLHPGHVTKGRPGSWEGNLEQSLVAELESRYHGWFAQNGYPASDIAHGAPDDRTAQA